jgi:hypothetical protein
MKQENVSLEEAKEILEEIENEKTLYSKTEDNENNGNKKTKSE